MYTQLLKIVNGPTPGTALALIIHDDGSLENPGQLLLEDFTTDKLTSKRIFYNGDSIYDVWISPAGDIWLSSSYGNIYTTADVTFPESPVTSNYNLDYPDVKDSGYNWKMYTLGAVVSADTIWSPDGKHIFIGTYGGHIFYWDGTTWTKQETPTSLHKGKYIYQIAGSGVNNALAIGDLGSALHHYDGKTWETTTFDVEKHGRIAPHGLLQHPDGYCYIACEGGLVWKTRDGRQLELAIENPDLDFIGMAYAHDTLILAAGEKGVFAFKDEQLENIRNTFPAMSISGSGNQVVFIRPEKETADKITVAYAIFSDSPERPWYGYSLDYAK